ncbi:phage tail protein [Komagataeibacter sp. FXV3]|uniref:phage tail protein n=1 Tax=Komagataeibacter sp. FXV3 TaxID=2608998 RepID=UPI00187B9E19|nr:phage tail protein [Komagataeibacter sp. FXV3]MBE7728856.1 phage tail protein [Komagataeibacter sp. FXV3]
MSALSHTMGGDLDLSGTGGVAVVTGAEQTRQALLRRLCTNAGGYIWQPDYGAGLPARVGSVMDDAGIRALVLQQMQDEAGVDQTQPVTVTITSPKTGACLLAISYTDAPTGTVQELTLST